MYPVTSGRGSLKEVFEHPTRQKKKVQISLHIPNEHAIKTSTDLFNHCDFNKTYSHSMRIETPTAS